MADDVNDAIPPVEGPALSIVVPVYNGADTVASLVAAIEGLDVPGGVEVVLVVDGSPDNSAGGLPRPAADRDSCR